MTIDLQKLALSYIEAPLYQREGMVNQLAGYGKSIVLPLVNANTQVLKNSSKEYALAMDFVGSEKSDFLLEGMAQVDVEPRIKTVSDVIVKIGQPAIDILCVLLQYGSNTYSIRLHAGILILELGKLSSTSINSIAQAQQKLKPYMKQYFIEDKLLWALLSKGDNLIYRNVFKNMSSTHGDSEDEYSTKIKISAIICLVKEYLAGR